MLRQKREMKLVQLYKDNTKRVIDTRIHVLDY